MTSTNAEETSVPHAATPKAGAKRCNGSGVMRPPLLAQMIFISAKRGARRQAPQRPQRAARAAKRAAKRAWRGGHY